MPPKFKPGGRRFPPKVLAKPVPQQIQTDRVSSEPSSSSGLDPDTENKFELELCWCIQQLELSMSLNKLGDKQARDAQKSLKLLKSSNVPLIQKRQIMRNTFGDYRAKMLQEEKKHSRATASAKIVTPKPNTLKSLFVKKAHVQTDSTNTSLDNETNCESSGPTLSSLFKQSQIDEPFKFNFTPPDAN